LCEGPATHPQKNKQAKISQRTKSGRFKRNGRWRGLRNKNPKFYIGTWNIKTLLKPVKTQGLAEELAKTRLEIVAIQEVRWFGNGVIKKKDFSFYYSGTKEELGQAGTGFILMGKSINNGIGFEAINERICKIRMKGKFNNVTLINMYALTEDKADSEKENFYEELQVLIDQIPKSDTILVMGDANAKLGKEDIHKEVSGNHKTQRKAQTKMGRQYNTGHPPT
jgi:exonuclease III